MADTWSQLEPWMVGSQQAQNTRSKLRTHAAGCAPLTAGDRKWAWEGGARRKSVHPEGQWMVLTRWK